MLEDPIVAVSEAPIRLRPVE
jgi:hypothetical protein